MGPTTSEQQTGSEAQVRPQDHHGTELPYLFLSPNTEPGTGPLPTVLCFHGSGHTSQREEWRAVVEAVATFAPVLYYDRRGVVGISSSPRFGITTSHNNNSMAPTGTGTPSFNQTPEDAVQDLRDLLRDLHLGAPYILLAHSYGGTIARTFLQAHRGQVAGVVLAETGQETPTRYDEEQYRRRILGGKPLSVIHAVIATEEDLASTNGGGDGLGDGAASGGVGGGVVDQDRRRMRQVWAEEDKRLKKAQLQLSSNARYVRVDGCGHHVVRQRPDIVAEEVRWVFEAVLRGSPEDDEPSSGLGRLIKGTARRLSRKVKKKIKPGFELMTNSNH